MRDMTDKNHFQQTRYWKSNVEQVLFWCGGWDLNPRQAGDIEAELNVSRKSPFFLLCFGRSDVGKSQNWLFRVLFLAERIVSQDSVVSSNRIVNVGTRKTGKQINMLVDF
jgi:hypothetical protein